MIWGLVLAGGAALLPTCIPPVERNRLRILEAGDVVEALHVCLQLPQDTIPGLGRVSWHTDSVFKLQCGNSSEATLSLFRDATTGAAGSGVHVMRPPRVETPSARHLQMQLEMSRGCKEGQHSILIMPSHLLPPLNKCHISSNHPAFPKQIQIALAPPPDSDALATLPSSVDTSSPTRPDVPSNCSQDCGCAASHWLGAECAPLDVWRDDGKVLLPVMKWAVARAEFHRRTSRNHLFEFSDTALPDRPSGASKGGEGAGAEAWMDPQGNSTSHRDWITTAAHNIFFTRHPNASLRHLTTAARLRPRQLSPFPNVKRAIKQQRRGRIELQTVSAMRTTVHAGVREAICKNRLIQDIGSGVSSDLSNRVGSQVFFMILKIVMKVVVVPIIEIIIYCIVFCLMMILCNLFMPKIIVLMGALIPPAMKMMLGPLLRKFLLKRLSYILARTVMDNLVTALSRDLTITIGDLVDGFLILQSDPAVQHAIMHLTSAPIAKSMVLSITHEVTRGLTQFVTHGVTHAVIQGYYCQYCHRYNEYCQYCFYYNDYKWLHMMWTMGGEQFGTTPNVDSGGGAGMAGSEHIT